MISIQPIIGRVGGKARLAPWIIEQLTRFDWSIYCEPFVGSGAVYFRMVSEGVFKEIECRGNTPQVVLNDADNHIVQLFKVCRDRPEELASAVGLTPYSRVEHQLAVQQKEVVDEIEAARQYLVKNWQSFSHRDFGRWGIVLQKTKARNPSLNWNKIPERILSAVNALKRCYLENDNAIAVIKRWGTPHTCFYCDPPYIGVESYYSHNRQQSREENLNLHYCLAKVLNSVEAACVAVSYYPHNLLEELYPESLWERHYKETIASSAGVTRKSKNKKLPRRTEMLLIRKSECAKFKQLSLCFD